MDKLPAEILRKVFIHLSLEERIKYTLVCRKWWLVLDKCCLLYDVEIHDVNKFNRFMEMVEQSPHRADQVQELRMMNCLDHGFNKRELCNVFPNVRVMKLEWTGNDNEIYQYTYFEEPIEMTHSNSKLEYLHDSIYCELASQMLTSNLCSQLVELELDFQYTNNSRKRILSELKNLPLLKKLTLARLYIETNDLELLHANLPTIQDFRLHYISILSSEMPFKIVPADSITNFYLRIDLVDNIDMHSQFYQYMIKKYKHVTDIDFVDEALSVCVPYYVEHIYQNGGLDFLRLIGPKNTKLTFFNLPDITNIFATLDSVESKIEEFEFCYVDDGNLIQNLSQSNQSKYVKKLSILNSSLDLLNNLQTMKVLSAIKIMDDTGFGLTLRLSDYLNNFPPSVKKIEISGYKLENKRSLKAHSDSIEIFHNGKPCNC